MSLAALMTGTCTLKRCPATPPDALGTFTKANPVVVVADVACDIQPASSSTIWKYAQMQLVVSYSIYFVDDIAAREGDILVSGSRTFKVQGYRPPGDRAQWPAVADVVEEPS